MRRPIKVRWDYMVLLFSIWNAVIIPFDQAFDIKYLTQGSKLSDALRIFDYTVDFIFIIDLILGFFTSTTDRKGFITFNYKDIASIYTSQFRFYADFLSVFGSGWFE